MLTLSHYLILSAVLFSIGIVGIFLNRKNLIVLLMSIELMLLAVNTNFIAFSHYLQDLAGQVFVFFILTVAAAESAIGLAILIVLFRNLKTREGGEIAIYNEHIYPVLDNGRCRQNVTGIPDDETLARKHAQVFAAQCY